MFDEALKEKKFKDAVKLLRKRIPKELLLPDGQNPLLLLYNLLSIQVHRRTDEEFMQQAQAIQSVLNLMLENIASSVESLAKLRADVKDLERYSSAD